jgi:hypothetical protein
VATATKTFADVAAVARIGPGLRVVVAGAKLPTGVEMSVVLKGRPVSCPEGRAVLTDYMKEHQKT